MQNLIKGLDSNVEEILSAELLEIESEHVLFVHTKQVKNTPTKVFPGKSTSALKNKFKGTVTKDIAKLKAQWDETTIVAPSWVDTSKLNNPKRAGFHTVEINGKEAFTVKTDDFGWFYVAKKVEKPQPTIQTETFYTSTDKAFPVAMKDDQTVDIEESKKLLQNALPSITKQEDKELAEAFIAYADAAAELLEVEGKTLLFVKVNDHTTKVFHKEAGTHLKDAFKSSVATVGTVPSNADLTKAVSPTWITAGEQQDITHFIAVNDGYTLLTKSGHWFYAPIRLDIENFYGSNNKALQVVMQDANTVDLAQTKKLLAPNMHLLPDDLKAEAQDFIDNGTQNDVVIKEIEGVKLLFVKTSKHTKVFRTPATDTMFQNAFKGGTDINANIVYHNPIKPAWATSTEIVKYNEIKKDGKLIGYTLKDKDKHWFYAPAAHRVNFEMNGANAIVDQIIPLDGKATKPSNPTRPGYNFGGWFADKDFKTAFDFTTTITANTTIYAKWNRVSSGGGGSSGGSSYSAPVSSSTTGTITHSGTVDKPLLTDHCALHDPSYTDEENKAYQFACKHRITTMETIKKARIHDQVTRAEFAKMISNYAQNVLGKKPNTDLQCTFADQNQVNTELSNFITTSCQLGLMGIKMEQNRFLPNKTLSRAEVATVISRLYGFAEDSTPYYKDHLKAMNTKGFITKPVPHMTEVRGYIFIMLERIATTLK